MVIFHCAYSTFYVSYVAVKNPAVKNLIRQIAATRNVSCERDFNERYQGGVSFD